MPGNSAHSLETPTHRTAPRFLQNLAHFRLTSVPQSRCVLDFRSHPINKRETYMCGIFVLNRNKMFNRCCDDILHASYKYAIKCAIFVCDTDAPYFCDDVSRRYEYFCNDVSRRYEWWPGSFARPITLPVSVCPPLYMQCCNTHRLNIGPKHCAGIKLLRWDGRYMEITFYDQQLINFDFSNLTLGNCNAKSDCHMKSSKSRSLHF